MVTDTSQVSIQVGFSRRTPGQTGTIADILPRIRGGVDSCYVSGFEEKNQYNRTVTVSPLRDTIAQRRLSGVSGNPRAPEPVPPSPGIAAPKSSIFRSAPGWETPEIVGTSSPRPSSPQASAASLPPRGRRHLSCPRARRSPNTLSMTARKANGEAQPRANGPDKRPDQRVG